MRALIQRVAEARVEIVGETVSEVGNGMLILICAMQGDGDDEARLLARKIANLRIFESEPGKMNLSILASGGGCAGREPVHPRRRHEAAATDPAFRAPLRRTKACGSMSSSQPPLPNTGCPSQPGASGRSCRSTSSTTARSRSGSIRRADRRSHFSGFVARQRDREHERRQALAVDVERAGRGDSAALHPLDDEVERPRAPAARSGARGHPPATAKAAATRASVSSRRSRS